MTDDEIAAVKARHAADQERRDRNGPYYMVADDMHADRAALLAEVERLRVKNERLRERLLQERAALVLDEIGAALERERVLRAALEGKQ